VSRPVAGAAAVLAAFIAACQAGGPTSTGAGPDATGGAAPTGEAPATLGPPPSPTAPDETSAVTLDSAVLRFLPEDVDGVPVTESVDEATQALGNPSLPGIATAVDAAVAVDTGRGNLVYAWVVRLRPDRFTDEVYRQWRDSYDEGACSGAGGVTGHAEATLDDRTVYITSCVQGLRAYHVWLEHEAILVSASATGDARFGEVLMDTLRVPS
jgi:hypothetical protein